MKEINGTTYYTKQEIRDMLGCSMGTINARILAAKIKGFYIAGHAKYYTAAQVTQIAEYRKEAKQDHKD